MFGHQAIEGLKGMSGMFRRKNQPQLASVYDFIVTQIQNAQHFHVGEWRDLHNLFKRTFDDNPQLFLGSSAVEVRMPYKLCWFDYMMNGEVDVQADQYRVKKRGILAVEHAPDLIQTVICNCVLIDAREHWIVSPLAYLVSVGMDFEDNETGCKMLAAWEKKLGVPQEKRFNQVGANVAPMPVMDIRSREQFLKAMNEDRDDLTVLNQSLMLLNCRNIGTEKHPAPAALNKKRQKKGKQPLFSYRTVVLKPVGKQQRSIPKQQWENRVHLCRGHFKTYTADNPLFGRFTGRYWWQAHARGQSRRGMVHKDYQVDAKNFS